MFKGPILKPHQKSPGRPKRPGLNVPVNADVLTETDNEDESQALVLVTQAAVLGPAEEDVIIGEIVNPALTEAERAEYNARLARIRENIQTVTLRTIDVWRDLSVIHEARLWRGDYTTFAEFCSSELGYDTSQVYRFMDDAKVRFNLLASATSDQEALTLMTGVRESAMRSIRELPAEVQSSMWRVVYETAEELLPQPDSSKPIAITASFVRAVVEKTVELATTGGVHLDGEFRSVEQVTQNAAAAQAIDPTVVRQVLLQAAVTEEVVETMARQKQHIVDNGRKHVVRASGILRIMINPDESTALIVEQPNGDIDIYDWLSQYNGERVTLSLITDK